MELYIPFINMYYYFSSDYLVAIKINGIYYGTIFDTIKSINIQTEESPFIEICPLAFGQTSVNFLLDSSFLSCPPENVAVTDLKGGYLIKFFKVYKASEFKVLTQQKFPHALITVFNENGLKISIETANDFFAQSFNVDASSAQTGTFTQNGVQYVYACLNGQKNLLCIYRIDNKIEKVFERNVDSFNADSQLETTEQLHDIAKHEIRVIWTVQDGYFKEQSRTITCSSHFNVNNLPKNLIPYAFLEQLYVGDKLDDYLEKSLLENVNLMKDYFGNYIGIMPPPMFREPFEIGLIYSNTANTYSVEYFTFDLENRKIINFNKV